MTNQITTTEIFTTNYILVSVYESINSVSIKAAIRGQVRPSSVYDKRYQVLNPEKYVELTTTLQEANEECQKNKGMKINELPSYSHFMKSVKR